MFKPGQPKIGGRQKGTPNKINQELMDKCKKMGVDVFEVLLEFARSGSSEYRFKAASELAQYLYPKRKSVEISLADLSDEEIAQEAKARLNAANTR